jgi:hypothetical protein
MKHLTEDEMVERYYGEDLPDGARHLETCSECGRAYAALKSDLNEVAAIEPPPRDERYGEEVWRSLSPFVAAYPERRPAHRRVNLWLRLAAAGACAVLVAAAFYAGRVWEHRQPHTTVAKTPAPAPHQRVVIVVLSDHLDRTERLLVELKHADADDQEMISPMRDEAGILLAANQRFKEDAEKSGDPDLSAALDRIDRLLTQMTSHPGGLDAVALARLRHEMDTDGLLFEVRVLRSRIPGGPAKQNSPLKGGAA